MSGFGGFSRLRRSRPTTPTGGLTSAFVAHHRPFWRRSGRGPNPPERTTEIPTEAGRPRSSEPLLSVSGLEAGYGAAPVLRGVNVTIDAGEVVAVIGANGAGKSTLAAVLCGLLRPRSGSIRFAGDDVTTLGPEERLRRGLAVVPEGRRLFLSLSVGDNLAIGGRIQRQATIEMVFDLLPGLVPIQARPAGSLPVEEQALCAIGRAVAACPALLVLDEPTLGLDPEKADELLAIVPDIAARGLSVLLIEADAGRALGHCERAIVLAAGRVVREGSPGALLADLNFIREYVWG